MLAVVHSFSRRLSRLPLVCARKIIITRLCVSRGMCIMCSCGCFAERDSVVAVGQRANASHHRRTQDLITGYHDNHRSHHHQQQQQHHRASIIITRADCRLEWCCDDAVRCSVGQQRGRATVHVVDVVLCQSPSHQSRRPRALRSAATLPSSSSAS